MGRIKAILEWIGAAFATALAVIVGVFVADSKKEKEATHEAERVAEADHASVQHEREHVGGESASDLYRDLTGGGK